MEPPAEPADGVAQGVNLAALVPVNHLNGNEPHGVTGADKGQEHLGLDLKVGGAEVKLAERIKAEETEAALGIGQPLTSGFREAKAHPLVHTATQPGHPGGVGHAVANDEVGAARVGLVEKGGNVVG